MDIAWDAKGEYRKNLEQFLRYGGAHSQAAKKACEIESKLKLGIDVRSQTTDHGESRIRNCVKYDLGNGYRLVTVQQAEVIIFLYIGDHDLTQRWLDRHRGLVPVVNRKTWKVEFTIPNAPQPWELAPQTAITLTNIPFLEQVNGIDWRSTIRSAATRSFLLKFDKDGDNQELLDILDELGKGQPREAQLCLIVINYLRSGQLEAAQAAVDLYLGHLIETSAATPLTGEMLRAESNQGRFVVINDLTEDELERLHDPLRFREWMIFLHPGQRRVADEDFAGPALLTGVSGSGKTCVLVHRARRLAQLFPRERILILTLNHSLARLIEILVDDLCLDSEKQRIFVKPFHGYLSEFLGGHDCENFLRSMADFTEMHADVDAFIANTPSEGREMVFQPHTEREQLDAFERFLKEAPESTRNDVARLEVFVYSQDQQIDLRRYLFEELELVRSAFTCYDSYRGYLGYNREGRAVAFQENRRQAILGILREWERFQIRRGFLDLMGLAQAAVFAVDDKGEIPIDFRYRSVLVDEFQDLSTLELSLLQKIPTAIQNGLFLTGDFAQKIYAKDLNLPEANLGRSQRTDRVIRRNYRNSRQVLLAAQALLEAFPPQLLAGEDDGAILKPEYASKESAVPIATQANHPIHAAWRYAQEWLEGGNVPFSVCIATANPNAIPAEAILRLKPTGIEADVLTGDYLLKPNRVVVADVSAVKGFEFSLIVVCGLDDNSFPPPGVPSAEHWREALRLYVAITRGRDEVRFIYRDNPSVFLLAMADRIQFQRWDCPLDCKYELDEMPSEHLGEASKAAEVEAAEEAERQKAAEEEAKGIVAEAERRAIEEARISLAEAKRREAEEAATKAAHEAEKRAAEEAQRRANEEAARAARDAEKRAAQEAERKAVEEAAAARAAQDAQRRADEETVRHALERETKEFAKNPVPKVNGSAPAHQSRRPTEQANPVDHRQQSAREDALRSFWDSYKPQVLNGILILPIPSAANQRELARALGRNQTAVGIACQEFGHFTAPDRPLPTHIIQKVCDYFRCVPNIISFRRGQ